MNDITYGEEMPVIMFYKNVTLMKHNFLWINRL